MFLGAINTYHIQQNNTSCYQSCTFKTKARFLNLSYMCICDCVTRNFWIDLYMESISLSWFLL